MTSAAVDYEQTRRRYIERAKATSPGTEAQAAFLFALQSLDVAVLTYQEFVSKAVSRSIKQRNGLDDDSFVASAFTNAVTAVASTSGESNEDVLRETLAQAKERWTQMESTTTSKLLQNRITWLVIDYLDAVFQRDILRGEGVDAAKVMSAGFGLLIESLPYGGIVGVLTKIRELLQGELDALKVADKALSDAQAFSLVAIQWSVAAEIFISGSQATDPNEAYDAGFARVRERFDAVKDWLNG